jgi:hypothetical protein
MNNFLDENIGNRLWYKQRPSRGDDDDDDNNGNKSIIFQVPTIDFFSRTTTNLTDEIIQSIHHGVKCKSKS